MDEVLPCQRGLFDIPADVAYLNCAYYSPLLRTVRDVGEAGVGRKSRPWELRPVDFFTESETARSLFARLIGGDADGVAIVPSVSYGMAIAAANVPVDADEAIVLLADQFPSNVYPWRELARRAGGHVVTVPRPEDEDWTTAVLEHIDERTALVAVPNCHWMDGGLIDLRRVGERARAVGAALVIDATQSLGAYPFDVAAVQPDFLVAGTYKWLLGPYGLGFLYIAPRHREGVPIELNWLNRAGSEDFRNLIDYRDDFQPGARRFDVGERANPILLPMAIVALQQLFDWGVPAIERTLRELTGSIEAEAARCGIRAVPDAWRVGHMIGLRLPSDAPADLDARLAAAQIYVSMRGQTMRVSPHVYNDRTDIERLFAVLAEAI